MSIINHTLGLILVAFGIPACSTPATSETPPVSGLEETKSTPESTEVDPCEQGDAHGCYLHARTLESDADPAAVESFETACLLGSRVSCAHLGANKMWGLTGEPEPVRALNFNRRACNEMRPLDETEPELDEQQSRVGQVYGCTNLAHQYENAKGVEEDLDQAFELWSWACTKSDILAANGCSQVGYFYTQGISVEAAPQRALDYYIMGCEFDEGMGCCNGSHLLETKPELSAETTAIELHERATALKYTREPLP